MSNATGSSGLPEGCVWYAGFGANLDDARFSLYLSGGTLPGLNRVYRGARDRTPAQGVATCVASGRMRFAGSFDVWGSGGGAAFYVDDPSRTVILRAHLISVAQLADLVLQENGLQPSETPALSDDVAEQLGRFVGAYAAGAGVPTLSLAGLPAGGEVAYDSVHLLDAYGLDGRRYEAVVLGARCQPERNAPPVAYLQVIREGLEGSCGLSGDIVSEYLESCLANL